MRKRRFAGTAAQQSFYHASFFILCFLAVVRGQTTVTVTSVPQNSSCTLIDPTLKFTTVPESAGTCLFSAVICPAGSPYFVSIYNADRGGEEIVNGECLDAGSNHALPVNRPDTNFTREQNDFAFGSFMSSLKWLTGFSFIDENDVLETFYLPEVNNTSDEQLVLDVTTSYEGLVQSIPSGHGLDASLLEAQAVRYRTVLKNMVDETERQQRTSPTLIIPSIEQKSFCPGSLINATAILYSESNVGFGESGKSYGELLLSESNCYSAICLTGTDHFAVFIYDGGNVKIMDPSKSEISLGVPTPPLECDNGYSYASSSNCSTSIDADPNLYATLVTEEQTNGGFVTNGYFPVFLVEDDSARARCEKGEMDVVGVFPDTDRLSVVKTRMCRKRIGMFAQNYMGSYANEELFINDTDNCLNWTAAGVNTPYVKGVRTNVMVEVNEDGSSEYDFTYQAKFQFSNLIPFRKKNQVAFISFANPDSPQKKCVWQISAAANTKYQTFHFSSSSLSSYHPPDFFKGATGAKDCLKHTISGDNHSFESAVSVYKCDASCSSPAENTFDTSCDFAPQVQSNSTNETWEMQDATKNIYFTGEMQFVLGDARVKLDVDLLGEGWENTTGNKFNVEVFVSEEHIRGPKICFEPKAEADVISTLDYNECGEDDDNATDLDEFLYLGKEYLIRYEIDDDVLGGIETYEKFEAEGWCCFYQGGFDASEAYACNISNGDSPSVSIEKHDPDGTGYRGVFSELNLKSTIKSAKDGLVAYAAAQNVGQRTNDNTTNLVSDFVCMNETCTLDCRVQIAMKDDTYINQRRLMASPGDIVASKRILFGIGGADIQETSFDVAIDDIDRGVQHASEMNMTIAFAIGGGLVVFVSAAAFLTFRSRRGRMRAKSMIPPSIKKVSRIVPASICESHPD